MGKKFTKIQKEWQSFSKSFPLRCASW